MENQKQTKLKIARFPRMIGEVMHTNQFLKVFSLTSLVLNLLLLGMTLFMILKNPLVITLSSNGSTLQQVSLPKVEDEIREAVKYYLGKRYHWNPEDVKLKMKETASFIAPTAIKAFSMAASNIVLFSTGKIVSQKIYPEKIEIEMNKKVALISGDRLTTIQGMKAAGDLKLELTFESGTRTKENPWGLYISKEREE